MENIIFSRGLTIESFNGDGITDIGQFNSEDKKILKKLVRSGILIQFKRQWYPNLGRLRNAWIKADSPNIKYHNGIMFI